LNEIYKKYEGKVVVIGFSKDDNEDAVKSFLAKVPVSYPVAMSNRKVEEMFGGILGLPTSFLIDKNGRIVRRFLGYVPPDILEENIKRLL
jgi:thiol-disulfide isomerase/thioredoxin